MPITLRPFAAPDLPAILDIHNDAVRTTTAIWQRHEADLENRARYIGERLEKGFPFLVADSDGAAVGYATFGPFRAGDCYERTVEHSVYVQQRQRNQGIAGRLMEALFAEARDRRLAVMVGAIGSENEGSLRLHRRFGFVETGRMPGIGEKFGRLLDLVIVQKTL